MQVRKEYLGFGCQHWSLFSELLDAPMELPLVRASSRTYQPWAEENVDPLMPSFRQRFKGFIYRVPGGAKLVLFWRKIRGR